MEKLVGHLKKHVVIYPWPYLLAFLRLEYKYKSQSQEGSGMV
jgi:hypothetical protein